MNQGNDYPRAFSRPTTYASYGDESHTNPYASGQLGFDPWSLNRQGYRSGYGEGNTSPSSENRELALDNWPSMHRDYGNGNRFLAPENRPFRLDHRRSSFQDVRQISWFNRIDRVLIKLFCKFFF